MIAPQMPSETGTIMTSIFVIVPVQSAFSLFTRRSLPTDHPRIQAKLLETAGRSPTESAISPAVSACASAQSFGERPDACHEPVEEGDRVDANADERVGFPRVRRTG